MTINKKMSILGVIREFPGSKEVFERYNMSCASCGGAEAESLERGAEMHGLDPDVITEELNKFLKES